MNPVISHTDLVDPVNTESTESTTARSQPGVVAILVGGYLSNDEREAIALGTRPRVDVLDIAARYESNLYDFGWVDRQATDGTWSRRLLARLRPLLGWSTSLALLTYARMQNADVVYTTGEDIGLPLATLLRLMGRREPRLIVRMEQPIYGRTPIRRFFFSRYFQFAIGRVDRVLCRTRAHAHILRSEFGVPEASVTFTPETTDVDFFNPSQRAQDSVPDIPDEPYILSAGMEMRDYETLIKAASDLPLKVVIAAGSPWSHLQFNSPMSEPPPNVRLDSFQRFQMRELYRSACLVVVPVHQTERACGMNVVLEAWAMKKPVIATRTKGLVDYIDDGNTGLFTEVADVTDLRAKILYLLKHPEDARRLGETGHDHVLKNLTIDQYLEEVDKTVTALLTAPSGELL